MKKVVVITGCGRSGTLYMTEVMKCFGYNIGHEELLEDGISSWYIVNKDRWLQLQTKLKENKIYNNRDFVYIHLIRNPLEVIKSMFLCEVYEKREALNFVRRNVREFQGKPKTLSFVAEWWLKWNEMAEKKFKFDYTLKVEEMNCPEEVWAIASLLDIMDYKKVEIAIDSIQSLGTKVHTIKKKHEGIILSSEYKNMLSGITLNDIRKENEKIAKQLEKIAREKYGYYLM